MAETIQAKNRWKIAFCAVCIHISIGSVYAWSVFIKPLMAEFGCPEKEVQFSFILAIVFLGLSAAFLGKYVERYGPRVAGSFAAVFFGAGLLGSGLAVQLGSLKLLYLFYGVIGGIGLGCGYIAPVSSLVKWFPDRRGLATGLAIMGFGFAALLAGPIMTIMINKVGPSNTFYIFGALYFLLMLASSQYLAPPQEGWMPAKMLAKMEQGHTVIKKDLAELNVGEAIRTKRFYYLWLMLFINVTCGIAIISVASKMGQEMTGMSELAAGTMVGIMGLCNGVGRIAWASVSDFLGRANTYLIFFLLQIGAFFLLPQVTTMVFLFQGLIYLILTCYGGGFSSIPAFIGDLFGTKQLGAIHGYILTAWSAAAIAGPMLMSYIREKTDSYAQTPIIFSVMFIFATVISLLMKWDIRRLKKQNMEAMKSTEG